MLKTVLFGARNIARGAFRASFPQTHARMAPQFLRMKHTYANLKVNQDRMMGAIHDGCRFGEAHRYGEDPTETGMARLSLNDADKQIRDWFKETVESIGCSYSVDEMGNQFAVRKGKNSSKPPVMMGSHLDTQPTGGRYDGILGVNAGLEALKVLYDHDVTTEGNVGLVNWTNEEGARFPMMAISSGVWAESVPLDTAWNLAEVSPSQDGSYKTMKQELERIGYLGKQKASYQAFPFAAYFELHIGKPRTPCVVLVCFGSYLLTFCRTRANPRNGEEKDWCCQGCSGFQMVRDNDFRSRQSCWDNSNECTHGSYALRSEVDCEG